MYYFSRIGPKQLGGSRERLVLTKQDFAFNLDIMEYRLRLHENFDNYDWSIEPKESFSELCKRRAEQLRAKYDHIILYYSGGIDSNHVYRTFKDNNIPLDEIIYYRYSDSKADMGFSVAKENNFDNITIVNINYENLMKVMKSDIWAEDKYNINPNPHCFSRFRIDYYEKLGIVKPKRRNGNICHLFAESYPGISIEYGDEIKVNTRFSARRTFSSPISLGNVGFFTHEDMPELHAKQSHMMIKYLLKKHKPINQSRYEELVDKGVWQSEITEEKKCIRMVSKFHDLIPQSPKLASASFSAKANLDYPPGTEAYYIMKAYANHEEERKIMDVINYNKYWTNFNRKEEMTEISSGKGSGRIKFGKRHTVSYTLKTFTQSNFIDYCSDIKE